MKENDSHMRKGNIKIYTKLSINGNHIFFQDNWVFVLFCFGRKFNISYCEDLPTF